MPTQDAHERRKNFYEVALGYDEETAVAEAERCLNCKTRPCASGCPVGVDIPEFVEKVAERNFAEAARILKTKNVLPAICGRVCPQEVQCEMKCVLNKKGEPVAVGRLERFVADWAAEHPKEDDKTPRLDGKKVAVVGSGPSGLTAAAELAKLGHRVTIFEAFHKAGGVLVYGIPEFRLPKTIVKREVEDLRRLGVEIKLDSVIGRLKTIDEFLDEGYEAVYLAVGAGLPKFLGIPGENLIGVYMANEFLTRTNLMKAYLFPKVPTPVKVGRTVVVVGGGNVAMDAARTAVRLGAEKVTVLYRRTREEMPARAEEIEHAAEEGIKFVFLASPIEITGDAEKNVTGIIARRMELGEADPSGRRRPVPINNSDFTIEADTVIVAIGSGANPLLTKTTPDLELNDRGYIAVDPQTFMTSKPGVFAGGDIVTGSATVILAMEAGQRAAHSIHGYLSSK